MFQFPSLRKKTSTFLFLGAVQKLSHAGRAGGAKCEITYRKYKCE